MKNGETTLDESKMAELLSVQYTSVFTSPFTSFTTLEEKPIDRCEDGENMEKKKRSRVQKKKILFYFCMAMAIKMSPNQV